jgi:hypothetical protein
MLLFQKIEVSAVMLVDDVEIIVSRILKEEN